MLTLRRTLNLVWAYCPPTSTTPLDLYLNKRLADFEQRLQEATLQTRALEMATPGQLITEACSKIYRRFSRGGRRPQPGRKPQQGPQGPTTTEQATGTITLWAAQKGRLGKMKDKELETEEVVKQAWQAR